VNCLEQLAGGEEIVIIGAVTNPAQADDIVSAAVQMRVRASLVERRSAVVASRFH